VLALLDFFNNLEVQYTDNDQIITKSVPIRYKTREKLLSQDKSTEQVLTGNTNVLPRAELDLTDLSPDTERQVSKYLKINRLRNDLDAEFQWNCLSYTFSFEVKVLCRGMNEVSQIIEQVCPKFNPNVAIDIRDAENESVPTRIPLQLGSVKFEAPEYDEKSNNIFTVSFDLTLLGYLFEPIKKYSLVKEFNINLNTPSVQSVNLKTDVKNSIPNFDFKRTEFLRDDVLVLEDLRLERNGDTVTVKYRCNSLIPPKITFISDTVRILEQTGDTAKIEIPQETESFDICAKLKKNSQYYTVFKEFSV
jgi:hypothetical protein